MISVLQGIALSVVGLAIISTMGLVLLSQLSTTDTITGCNNLGASFAYNTNGANCTNISNGYCPALGSGFTYVNSAANCTNLSNGDCGSLSAGFSWNVTGTVHNCTNGTAMTFAFPNTTYKFSDINMSGYTYSAAPSTTAYNTIGTLIGSISGLASWVGIIITLTVCIYFIRVFSGGKKQEGRVV